MVIKELNGPQGGFTVRAKNNGRTPAQIAKAHLGCVAVTGITALPKQPVYGPGVLVQDRIVVPDEAGWIVWFDRGLLKRMLGEDFAKAINKEKQIFVFGTVIYRDLLTPSANALHETRWICLFQLDEEGDGIHNIEGLGVSGEYERYT
jgi:hypothetical protein